MEACIKVIALALALLASGCAETTSAGKIAVAQEVMRRQVASDISISIDATSVTLHEPGGDFYYVCGISTLNRPGEGRLALNNVRQRFVTTVNKSGGGRTLFDGSSSVAGKAEFRKAWAKNCPNNAAAGAPTPQLSADVTAPPPRDIAGLSIGQAANLAECEKEHSYGYVHYVSFPSNVPCWALRIPDRENLALAPTKDMPKDGSLMAELGGENVPEGVLPWANIKVIDGKIEQIELATFGASRQAKIFELLTQKWGKPQELQHDPGRGIEAQWLLGDFTITFFGVLTKPDEGVLIVRSAIAAAKEKEQAPKHATSF